MRCQLAAAATSVELRAPAERGQRARHAVTQNQVPLGVIGCPNRAVIWPIPHPLVHFAHVWLHYSHFSPTSLYREVNSICHIR